MVLWMILIMVLSTLSLGPRTTVWLCTHVTRDTYSMEGPDVHVSPVENGLCLLHLAFVSSYQWSSLWYSYYYSVAVDCGALEAPANGHVDTSQGTLFMNTAVYSCAPGYNLTGCSVSECLSTGSWSCDPPFCAGRFSYSSFRFDECTCL